MASAPNCLSKASQSFAAGAAKESPIIFFGDMCGEENTSQAASVEFVRRRRTNYARSRLQSLCQKVILFDSPQGRAPYGVRPLLFFKMFCGVFSAQRAEIPLEDQARRDGIDRPAVLFLLAAVGV